MHNYQFNSVFCLTDYKNTSFKLQMLLWFKNQCFAACICGSSAISSIMSKTDDILWKIIIKNALLPSRYKHLVPDFLVQQMWDAFVCLVKIYKIKWFQTFRFLIYESNEAWLWLSWMGHRTDTKTVQFKGYLYQIFMIC